MAGKLRENIMDKCPDDFKEELEDFINEVEDKINKSTELLVICSLADLNRIEDAYYNLCQPK